MADKSFGIKELNLIGASGTPTITSPNNLNLNASNVAISTDVTIGRHLDVDGHAEFDAVNVSGVSTFSGITTVPGPSLFTNQLSVSGISTFLGAINVNDSYGTSGEVLTSQGSGSAPQWASVSTGPTLMTEIDCNGVNSALFNGIPDGVNTIRAGFYLLVPPSTAPTVFMAFRVRIGGNGTDLSTNSYYYTSNSGTTITESAGSTSYIVMNGSNVTAASQSVDGVLTITKIDADTSQDRYSCHWQLGDHSTSRFISHGVGAIDAGNYISALRFFTPAGANWQGGLINVTYS